MSDVGRMMAGMSMTTRHDHSTSVPPWTLGWRLQRSLAHAGITSAGMADELGVARSTVSRWMNDHGSAPRAAFVKQWALRTGVPYEWLKDGETPNNGPNTPDGQVIRPSRWMADTRHTLAA